MESFNRKIRIIELEAMNIRKSILSKSKQDIACSLFLFLIIPVIFYYEIQVKHYKSSTMSWKFYLKYF